MFPAELLDSMKDGPVSWNADYSGTLLSAIFSKCTCGYVIEKQEIGIRLLDHFVHTCSHDERPRLSLSVSSFDGQTANAQ